MNEAEDTCLLNKQNKVFLENIKEKTKQVTCLMCKQKVTVELMCYGFGHIGICPNCGQLAYSGN